jgi:hypothetical protein
MMAMIDDRDEDRPAGLKTAVLSVLLSLVTFAGFGGAVSIVVVLLFFPPPHFVWGSRGAWMSLAILAAHLLIGGVALWGLIRLKPWKGWSGPASPAMRRTNRLYWLKEGLATVAMLVVVLGATPKGHPFMLFSNGPIPLWVALVAVPSWLLARVLREGWRNSADEHERRASDFGRNAAAGVFLAVTPAWWIAARAGLMPQPDAMVLWIAVMMVSSIGWSWRRYN